MGLRWPVPSMCPRAPCWKSGWKTKLRLEPLTKTSKAQVRSFTSLQMFHTHAPLPRGFFMEVTNGEGLLSVPWSRKWLQNTGKEGNELAKRLSRRSWCQSSMSDRASICILRACCDKVCVVATTVSWWILGNPMSDQHFQTIATAGANVGSCRPARECRRNDASNWQGEWPDASCLCSLHFLLWHDQRFHWRSTQVACSVLLHDDLLLSLPGGLVCSSQVAIRSSWRCEYVGLCSVSGFLIELRVRQPLGRVKIFF